MYKIKYFKFINDYNILYYSIKQKIFIVIIQLIFFSFRFVFRLLILGYTICSYLGN